VDALQIGQQRITEPVAIRQSLAAELERIGQLNQQVDAIERRQMNPLNYELNQLRLERRRLELDPLPAGRAPEAQQALDRQTLLLQEELAALEADLRALRREVGDAALIIRTGSNAALQVPAAQIVRIWQPNQMSAWDKASHFVISFWRFLSEDPREANTEGGVFPAIFGTVLMVLLMSVLVTPLGVIAAIYLMEYAEQGPMVRLIRIAVNNLAGVPSIVYGVFGLGFFVYFIGGSLDQLFFDTALPAPTFGTPGLLWASLTLALLTVPVVIVSTEEGLARIPRTIREGSLALGATRAETLFRVVLPLASPSILTGAILAVARAAGEVAPLMLVGVVKSAPSLAIDGNFPFLHLERKFMHLGFHIYDVGFQSPNVEAAQPLVYATALLLVAIIVLLNLAAILLRSRLERRYRAADYQ
jgi:phosphate transport system permease protein